MFVILFAIYLKGFLTESPYWHKQFTDLSCSKYWWTNLLYINNFYPRDTGEMVRPRFSKDLFIREKIMPVSEQTFSTSLQARSRLLTKIV